MVGNFFYGMDFFCIWIFSRISVIKRIDIGQQNQKIGGDTFGDNGRQRIVIAEFDFFDLD